MVHELYTEQRIKERHHVEKVAIAQIPSGTASETFEKPIFVADHDATIQGITIVPAASIDGDDTNYFVITLINKTQSAVIATQSMTPSTESWPWFEGFDLTIDNDDLSAGDVISFKKSIAGAGQANPEMCVAISFKY